MEPAKPAPELLDVIIVNGHPFPVTISPETRALVAVLCQRIGADPDQVLAEVVARLETRLGG